MSRLKQSTNFLEKKTGIKGIAIKGIPLGSPRMEMHYHESHCHDHEKYKVVSFRKTGKAKKFDKVSYEYKY